MNFNMGLVVGTVEPQSEFLTNLFKSLDDYGALIVLGGIYIFISFLAMRKIINSYSKTIDGIIPKLSETDKNIYELQRTFNETMGAHNAHTNQSLRTLERDSKDMHDSLLECQKNLKEIEGEMTILRSNYETLFRIMLSSRTGVAQQQYNHNKPECGKIYINSSDIKDKSYVELDD